MQIKKVIKSRTRFHPKIPGILIDTPSMATHFFQDLDTFESRFNLLQQVLHFYRKHPVEPLGRPKSILERDLKIEVFW